MIFIEKIKSVFKSDNKVETDKFIVAQQSCPQCASRGLFIFKDTQIISKTVNEVELKDQCQSELVED